MSATPLCAFVPPTTVAPGEYLVSCHEHYTKTRANLRWHREPEPAEAISQAIYDYDSDSESERASQSPSPLFSSQQCYDSDYDTPMSTPSPDYFESRESSPEWVPPTKTKTSGRRKTYRRLVTAETKAAVAQKIAVMNTARAQKASRTRAQAAEPSSGSIVCLWEGCKEQLSDRKELWQHIERVHKPLADAERASSDTPDVDMDDPFETGDEESDDDDEETHRGVRYAREGTAETRRGTRQPPYVDKYQTRIRCRWQQCTTTIQFAGLRRHIESKHSTIRHKECPKGCGYTTNRPDMMPRHAYKCNYRRPKREAGTPMVD